MYYNVLPLLHQTNNKKPEAMTTATQTIAKEILNQLGGNKFIVMTGSKNFIDGGNYLSMKLSRNSANAQYLVITIEWSDTYKMEFFSLNKNYERIMKAEFSGVYNDQLQQIFTKVTGLYTRM